jgi:hypothetical protein
VHGGEVVEALCKGVDCKAVVVPQRVVEGQHNGVHPQLRDRVTALNAASCDSWHLKQFGARAATADGDLKVPICIHSPVLDSDVPLNQSRAEGTGRAAVLRLS